MTAENGVKSAIAFGVTRSEGACRSRLPQEEDERATVLGSNAQPNKQGTREGVDVLCSLLQEDKWCATGAARSRFGSSVCARPRVHRRPDSTVMALLHVLNPRRVTWPDFAMLAVGSREASVKTANAACP